MPAKGVLDVQRRCCFFGESARTRVAGRTASIDGRLTRSAGGEIHRPYSRSKSSPMRFGLFGGASAPRGVDAAESARGLQQVVNAHVEAEELGFHSSFDTEHHFTGIGQMSAILTMLTFIAARTTRLRLGTAVLVLPWHNPVLLAEQVATLDLLSAGRFDLGVGKGYRHNEFAGFAMRPEEAEPRFEEFLAVLCRAFSSKEPFSHRGRFWRFDDIVVEPAPYQRPHPPIWLPAPRAKSITPFARRGYNLLL